jgi:fibronectin-binding autotransporter adhesin
MNRFLKMFCFFALAGLMTAMPLQAATLNWLGGLGTNPQDFGDPANWGAGSLGADDYYVNVATGNFPIMDPLTTGYTAPPASIASLTVGNVSGAPGRLDVLSGTIGTTGVFIVGDVAGDGTLNMGTSDLAPSVSAGGYFFVGNSGATGTANLYSGTVTAKNWTVVSRFAGSNGNLNLYGTSKLVRPSSAVGHFVISDSTSQGAITLGTSGGSDNPTLDNEAGGIFLGYGSGGTGTLTVYEGTVLANGAGMSVGNGGGNTGHVIMYGGLMSAAPGAGLTVGDSGGTGTMELYGTAEVQQNQTGGGGSGRFVLGSGSGSNGTLTLGVVGSSTDKPTFTIAGTSAGVIGDAGSTVTVNINSGTFNGNSTAYIGFGYNGATVEWNQNGGLTNFPSNSVPFMGCGGASGSLVTVNLNDGVFAIPRILTDWAAVSTTVAVNFDGGTLKANAGDGTRKFIDMRTNGTFIGTVKAGGAVWDTNGFTNTMQYSLAHDDLGPEVDGGLTKLGFGKLLLTASNNYTGPTDVKVGELEFVGSSYTNAVTVRSGAIFTMNNSYPFYSATLTPSQISVETGATLATKDTGVNAYADVTFSDKSVLSIACPYGYPSSLGIQKLSTAAEGDRVIVDLPGLGSGGGTVLTYMTRGDLTPTFVTRVDGTGMVDLSVVDNGIGTVAVSVSDQSAARGFRGQDSGLNPTGSWVNSQWLENGVVVASPNGTNARAWLNDYVLAQSVHNVTLDAAADVTLSSLLLNGSYTIAKKSVNPVAIKLQSSLALDTQIQAVLGDSVVAPDIKMAAGDPIITVADGASLTLSGVLSDLDSNHPAGVTINGPGTLTLGGANSYAGPTVLNSGTLKVGNASAVGAASGVFTLAGGTLADAGVNVALNKGFTIAGAAAIAPENHLTITGAVAYTAGSLTKLGAGTVTFNTPAATTNSLGPVNAEAGTLALDGLAGSVYNAGHLNIAGIGGSGNETSDPYVGAVAAMTVNHVGIIGTGGTVVGGYWSGDATPGTQPTGTLSLEGSATMSDTGVLYLGYWGGHGTVNVGASAALTVHNTVSVGYNWGDDRVTQYGVGEMNVNGHVVQDTAGSIRIGQAGGVGVWNQNAGLTETAATVTLGQSDGNVAYGAGTLSLNGGTFQTPGIAAGSTTSGSAASTLATINFNGGVLKAAADNANFIANTTGATMALKVLKNSASDLGAVIDTNGKAVTLSRPLVTGVTEGLDGGLSKLGAGTLTLAALNTYTGPTAIGDGTVQLKTNPLVIHQEASTAVNAVGDRLDGPYALGRSFTANSAVQVTQLGVFDSGGNGLGEGHVVHLTNLGDLTDTTVTFTTGSGAYQNGFRFLALDTPLSLNPGSNYKIWVASLGIVDIFDENVTTYDTGNGAISLGTYYWGYPAAGEPTSIGSPANETAVSFIYYNPSGVITADLLPVTTPVVMGGATGSTPTLDLQGADQRIASLADVEDAEVFGAVTNSATATSVVLTLSAASGETTYNGSIDGNISLVKDGDSTQNLLGSLTYTGDTTVVGGTLTVSGLNTPSSDVTVSNDAVLNAGSIVASTLTIGGSRVPAPAPVPEPGTVVLLALAGLGTLLAAWRRK